MEKFRYIINFFISSFSSNAFVWDDVDTLRENAGYSNLSTMELEYTAKNLVRPQKKVNDTDGSSTFYMNTIGDRIFGTPTSTGYYHMGIDIWESPHISNRGYSVESDYLYLPQSAILIAKTNNHGTYGNALVFLHPGAGRNNRDIYSVYLHGQDSTVHNSLVVGGFYGVSAVKHNLLQMGYKEVIGKIGGSGTSNGIDHLHYELRYFPQWMQPGYYNMYAKGFDKYDTRRKSYEDPLNYSIGNLNLGAYNSFYSTLASLSVHWSQSWTSKPRSKSEF